MTKNETAPRSIEGDWDWRETSINLPEGWIVFEKKPYGCHVWSFLGGGIMLSREAGRLRYVVEYRYNPDELRLALNGWQLDDRGERETPVRETYRVEFPGPAEMYLYDLDDLHPGEEESLRLKFRKTSCCHL